MVSVHSWNCNQKIICVQILVVLIVLTQSCDTRVVRFDADTDTSLGQAGLRPSPAAEPDAGERRFRLRDWQATPERSSGQLTHIADQNAGTAKAGTDIGTTQLNLNSESCPPLPIISNAERCQGAARCRTDSDCVLENGSRSRNWSLTGVRVGSSAPANAHAGHICCFNGCIKSCMRKVDAPSAFDWLEETEFKLQYINAKNQSSSAEPDPYSYPNTATSSISSTSAAVAIGGLVSVSSSNSAESANANPDNYYYDDSDAEADADTDQEQDPQPQPQTSFPMLTQSPRPPNLAQKSLLMSSKLPPETIVLPGGCLLKSAQYEHLQLFRKNHHVTACSCVNGDVVCEVNSLNTNAMSSSLKV